MEEVENTQDTEEAGTLPICTSRNHSRLFLSLLGVEYYLGKVEVHPAQDMEERDTLPICTSCNHSRLFLWSLGVGYHLGKVEVQPERDMEERDTLPMCTSYNRSHLFLLSLDVEHHLGKEEVHPAQDMVLVGNLGNMHRLESPAVDHHHTVAHHTQLAAGKLGKDRKGWVAGIRNQSVRTQSLEKSKLAC